MHDCVPPMSPRPSTCTELTESWATLCWPVLWMSWNRQEAVAPFPPWLCLVPCFLSSLSSFPGGWTPYTHILLLQIRRLAAQCIQKNLAVFLEVKDWPWWGLLASLRPLLSPTLSMEQLRAKEVGSCL